jgi:hypothetical protein
VAVVGAGNVGLAVVCWRRRTVLGGVAAVIGFGLSVFAAMNGIAGESAVTGTVAALIFLLLGSALLALGRLLERLLTNPPDSEDS